MAGPLKATFFAFRKRDRGGVITQAAIAFVIVMIALFGSFVALFWNSLGPLAEWYATFFTAAVNNDTSAIEQAGLPPAFFTVIGALFLWLFPIYIACAAFEAACLRWMIHGEQEGFFGLSLGAPTWRVWSCYWIWFLLNMGFSIALSLAQGVMIGMLTMSSGGNPAAVQTAEPVFSLLQLVLMIYFGIRLAPAAAATIARRKFSFFESWTVTKGRFWAMFGSYFILYLIYLIFSLALCVAWFMTVLGASAPDLASTAGDPARFEAMFGQVMQDYLASLTNPQSWIAIGVLQVVGAIAATMFCVAFYGVSARAALAALEDGKITPSEG